jgi:tetratricopeptide (TPR) repeat protein
VKALEQVLAAKDRGELKPADKETALRFGGTLYLLANNPEAARKCYVELLEMTPDDLVALNNLACLLAENMNPPRPKEALKYSTHAYDLLKRSGQHDVNIMDTHGWMLTLAGQTDAGIDILRQVNDARQMPEGHFHLGMAYLQKEFPEEAQRELDMASELLKRAKANKQTVDQSLEKRIEDGMARANTMLKNRKQANAPANAT